MRKRSFCKKLLSFILSLCLMMGGLGLQPVEVHAEGETLAGAVIYVGGEGATDESDNETWGYSADKPMKTLKGAYGKIPDDNVKSTIVVMSELVLAPSDKKSTDAEIASAIADEKKVYMTTDLDWNGYAQSVDYYLFPEHAGEVVITAKDVDGTPYDGKLNFGKHSFGLFGTTTIENIAISQEASAIYARYNDLTLGTDIKRATNSVSRWPATRIYMGVVTYGTAANKNDGFTPSSDVRDVRLEINSGSMAYVFGGNRYMTVNAAANCNVDIVVNGGEVTTLYGTSESVPRLKEGYHKNINITLNSGTVTNIYATHASGTVYGNVSVMVKPEAKVTGKIQAKIVDATYGTAAVSGKTILEFSGVGSTYKLPTIVNDFNCLSLTNSHITVADTSAENNAWWSAIEYLEMTDDSTLTFGAGAAPTTAVSVTASNADDAWNMSNPLITAPAGTDNIFTLTAPISHTFDYSATDSQTTWTLAKQTELPYGETTGVEGTAKDIDLELPDGTNPTAIASNATTYDTFLAKLADLTAAGSGKEVPVVGTVDIKGEIAIYVDPDNGVDSNKGTLAAPVKTIQKALEYVASLQSSEEPFKGIVVYLMGGTYNINETINITSAHSGENQIPVIISNYNDEEAVITGGTQIAGSAFKAVNKVSTDAYNKLPVAVRDKVVAVSLTELGISTANAAVTKDGQNYQVFVDGEELTLSRYPNATKLALTGKVLHVGEITNNGSTCGTKGTNAEDPNVRFEMTDLRPTLWENTGKIWLTGSLYAEWASTMIGVKDINATTGVMELNGGTGWGAVTSASNTYYYFNILEELDVPGEFYLDTEAGILYLYPNSDMSTATVTYSAMQDNLINLSQTKSVVLNGLTIECGAGYGIYMQGCTETLVQNCTLRNLRYGARIHGEQSGIIYSEIYQIGINPVTIGEAVYPDYDFTPEENFLQNCYIHSTGINKQGMGYVEVHGTGNVVSHNLLQGMAGQAIYLRYHKECIIEYNEIVGAPTVDLDMAAIYAPWETRSVGTHVRYNYIHDIGTTSNSFNPHGIYFDEGLRQNYAYGNIMENVPSGFFTNSGSENVIIHNIVANGRENTETSLQGGTMFDSFTLAERVARSSMLSTVYNNFYTLSEPDQTALQNRYPLLVKLFTDMKTAYEAGKEGEVGLFASQGNYVHENLIYNHGAINFTDKNDVDDNTVVTENPFTDIAAHDFTLTNTDLITWEEKIPSMDRIGILTENKEPISTFSMYTPSNGNESVDPFEMLFKWSNAGGADDYVVKISKNENMSEALTYTTIDRSLYFDNDAFFTYDTTYYWTVTANTTAESRIEDPVAANDGADDAIYSFKTMTKDEYLASNPLDTTALEETITEAETLLAQIADESDGGLYEDGTCAALQDKITAAEAVMSDLENQDQVSVNLAKMALAEQIRITKASKIIQYVTFEELSADDWESKIAGSELIVTVVGDELQVKDVQESGSNGQTKYLPGLGIRDILCFRYKTDSKTAWHGFALAQVYESAMAHKKASDGYFICIDYGTGEVQLQKRQNSTISIQLAKKIADIEEAIKGTLFKTEEYNDIEIGAINYADGSVGIHFSVNGVMIFDPEVIIDTAEDKIIEGFEQTLTGTPIVDTPTFDIVVHGNNGTEYLKLASTADYTALEAELAEEASLTQTDYTTDSWNAYQALVEEAEALGKNLLKSEQDVVDEMVAELKAARQALVAASNPTTPAAKPEIIAEGTDTSYTKGSNATVSIHCTGELEKLTGVKLDNQEVNAANYTVKEGSTIVTFKTAYLETLSVGEHTVTLLYSDGSSVDSMLTIQAAVKDDTDDTQDDDTSNEDSSDEDAAESVPVTEASGPNTGDDSNMLLWIMLLAVAAMLGGFITLKARKSKE